MQDSKYVGWGDGMCQKIYTYLNTEYICIYICICVCISTYRMVNMWAGVMGCVTSSWRPRHYSMTLDALPYLLPVKVLMVVSLCYQDFTIFNGVLKFSLFDTFSFSPLFLFNIVEWIMAFIAHKFLSGKFNSESIGKSGKFYLSHTYDRDCHKVSKRFNNRFLDVLFEDMSRLIFYWSSNSFTVINISFSMKAHIYPLTLLKF